MDNRKLRNEELGRMSGEDYKKAEKINVAVLLENVRSLHNVGSVFRTCDAFMAESLYLCGYTGAPPNKEIHKTALGATESVPWKKEQDALALIKKMKAEGYKVFSVEQTEHSVLLENFNPCKNEKYVLVFGNEVEGVTQEVVNAGDGSIEISQGGTKHSLNIAVCAGVVMWEFYKAMK